LTPVLVFDIETVPDVAGLRLLHQHPDAMSDAEVAQAALDARQAQNGSMFLPHHLHRIAAISCVFRDDLGWRVRSLGSLEDDEARLVADFFRVIQRYTPQLVSWNGSGFDLPVLHYRALAHGVPAPRYWDQGEEDREFRWNHYLGRYHRRHLDMMDFLALYNGRAYAPLDDIARLCGFPRKAGRGWRPGLAAVPAGAAAGDPRLLRIRRGQHLPRLLPLPAPARSGVARRL